jgi:hypothetical protein
VTVKNARGLRRAIAATALATLGVIIPMQSSVAVAPPLSPPTAAGVDISFPQCTPTSHVDLPANIPFAVIGVNGGVASNGNPCFQSEYNSALLLAGPTEQPHVSLYVNTGNPALAATWWPTDDTTQSGTTVVNPDGSCTHVAGAACAYVYGYSMAQADYRRVSEKLTRIPNLWWLDVETSNSWQTDVVANAASLTGMVDYFQGKGLDVGLYSTPYQWNRIAGATAADSHLAGLRSWLAGGSAMGAPVDCEKNALTPYGWVAMVQYVAHLDNDYSCRLFGAADSTIQPSDPTVVGTALTAVAGTWTPAGVAYSYQWNRDGVAIPGATAHVYTTTPSDIGTQVTVAITGMKIGYSTAVRSSGAITVLASLTVQSAGIIGTFSSGHTLTATTGNWGPPPVSFSYAWYRGTTKVSSGRSAASYVLSSADVGKNITVVVTGSKPGYAPVTESAISPQIDP